MGRKDPFQSNRREYLKHLGTSIGAITVASGATVASGDAGHTDVTETKEASKLLSAAGDPEVASIDTEIRDLGNRTIATTEAETEVGALVHNESLRGEETASYFVFDDSVSRTDLPKRFRAVPERSRLVLVLEDGQVHARRTATEEEKRLLREVLDSGSDEMIAWYDERSGSFGVLSEGGARTEVEINPGAGKRPAIDELTVSALQSGEVAVLDDGVSPMGCWGLSGPCTSCFVGGGICAGCSALCAAGSAGASCVLCLGGCAKAGTDCGCCLACLDDIPNEGLC